MTRSTVLVLLASTVIAAFVGWRVHAMNSEPVNHFAILADPSISYTGGCESAVGSAEQMLRGPGVSPRSKLILIVLGDGTTANEPRELGKYAMPISRKVIEGRMANERRQAALLREISSRCGSVRPTTISPIFMGVRQAVADLRSEGCAEGSHCKLRVNSDLDENVEAGIKSRLIGARKRSPLPMPLDNDGIDVTFCGYAATAGRIVDRTGREVRRFAGRNPAHEDRMQQTWLSIFTNPERVKFEPYCPKQSAPEPYATARLPRGHEKR